MAGLLEWSNAIRFTMENDPGRENLQSHLNTHGFIFLDDYLENILSGPCQDPIIELVKTPGRKKMTSKKSKGLGLSGSRKVPSLKQIDLERGQKPEEKATPPLNTLDKGLFQATVDLPTLNSAERFSQQMNTSDQLTASSDPLSTQMAADSSTSDSLTPDRLHQNDLSVIAEDDENPEPKPHSTLDSPSPQVLASTHNPVIPPSSPTLPEFDSTKAIDVSKMNTSTPHALLLDTVLGQPRVEIPDTHALDSNMGSRDFGLPSQDLSQVPSSGDKHGVALFPTLPAPIPLRKSVRTSRDPSVSTGHTGVTTPVVLQGGKRTSWLKKAREVKALEVTIKHPHTNTTLLAVPGPPSENVLKRKSVEELVSPEIIAPLDLGRNLKSVKSNETDEAPLKAMVESSQIHHKTPLMVNNASRQEGMLDRLKRTVEDLGAKVGKSINKSLGAAAATSALAEARAAAEARVVERIQKEEEMTRNSSSASLPALVADIPAINRSVNPEDRTSKVPSSEERRLSISDLSPPTNSSSITMKDDVPSRTTERSKRDSTLSLELDQSRDPTGQKNRESTTTTPPDSPPTSRHTSSVLQPEAVFGKHSPVFIPPVSVSNILLRDHAMDLPSAQTFPLPVLMPLGLGTRIQLPSSPIHTGVLSRQSTMESVQSNEIFDRTDSAAWIPETQDTDYSSRYGSQSQIICQTPMNVDDSWPTQERLDTGMNWTFGDTMKEDSMTWSTLPSQKEDSGRLDLHPDRDAHGNELEQSNTFPAASGINTHNDFIAHGDSDLKDMMHQSTISLVEKAPRSDCQVSTASLQSSRSHAGLSGQSLRPLGSTLSVSKKGNPEVKKVFQMAATAAKKQQEENDKKAARLKEMDNRRQLATQRKAEESRYRTLEQERKAREEGERRKREREENTDKRLTKPGLKDDDNGKKRKIASFESQKREAKKLMFKPVPKPSSLKPHSALGSSTAYNVSLQTVANSSVLKDSRPLKPPVFNAGTVKGKTPPTPSATTQDNISQPSQLVQIQMAARAKAQIQTAHLTSESQVISESIELPEINSEYSDSDDEDRSKALPGWAQSPELRQALQLQSTINPDDIFGAIRPLRMEEMFKDPNSLFRARTSSANWTGTDRLTMEEEREYVKRMGFK